MSKKKTVSKKAPAVNVALPTRPQLIVREHVDLSTSEVQFRLGLLDVRLEELQHDEQQLQQNLNACRRVLRTAREDHSALQSIVEQRRRA